MTATSQGHQDRVTQLLATADDLIKAGKQEDGALALREAITLSPDDEGVRQAFTSMSFSGDATLFSARAFISNTGDDKAGSALILAASNGRYSSQEAEEILELLFSVENDNPTKNDAIKRIVVNVNGRKAIATLLKKNATETFQHLWNCGDAVVSAIIAITLNAAAWSTEEARLAGSRDVLLLLLAKLLEPAQEASGMGMRAMARLLAVDAANIAPLIDASNFEVILSMLDIRQPTSTRSQAILVTSKFLEVEPERGQKLLTDYVVTRAGKPNVDDLVAAFSVAAAIFPVLPAVAASLFMTPGFLDDLIALTEKSNSARLGRASLELLSAACVDKTCREAISNTCAAWLQEVMKEKARYEIEEPGNNLDATLAALVLCKIQTVPKQAGVTIDIVAIASFLKGLTKDEDIATIQTAIEGLAYASIQGKVKEELSSDATFLSDVVTMLKNPTDKGVQFGVLTIVSNLTSYLPTNSVEQEKISQLKAYANQSKPDAADTLNDNEHVTARCRKVIDAGVVPILVNATKTASPTLLKIIANISLSLTKNPKHCGHLVQQGLFDTIIRLANIRPHTDIEASLSSAIHDTSSHALSRILVPLDPSLIFNNTNSQDRALISAITPLSSLLGPDETNTNTDTTNHFTPSQPVDKQATFDALRALTNIASLSDLACQLITATCFAQIETLLWSRISALTQAAAELISNLTQSPAAASKFFFVLGGDDTDKVNENHKADIAAARGRLTLLFALTTSETRGTALAAMAALSSILAYEAGVASFLALPSSNTTSGSATDTTASKANPTHRLINLTKEAHAAKDTDMLARALTAVCALVASGGSEARKCMSDADANDLLENLIEDEMVKGLGMRAMVGDAVAALK